MTKNRSTHSTHFRNPFFFSIGLIALCRCVSAQELAIDFESTTVGKPMPTWSEIGVTFELANKPKKSKAIGRIMFFPHIGTGRKGIVNAMANEAIPVRAQFSKPVKKVSLVLWGSTDSAAHVEAFDAQGKLLVEDSLKKVPVRKSPEEQVPFFELTVEAKGIDHLHISGSQPGGFIVIDEMRWTELETNRNTLEKE